MENTGRCIYSLRPAEISARNRKKRSVRFPTEEMTEEISNRARALIRLLFKNLRSYNATKNHVKTAFSGDERLNFSYKIQKLMISGK